MRLHTLVLTRDLVKIFDNCGVVYGLGLSCISTLFSSIFCLGFSNDFHGSHAIFTLFLPPPFASPCVQTPSSFPSASLSLCGRVKKVLISMGIASQSRLSCPKMAVVVVVYGSADFLLYFTTLSKKKDLFPRLGSLQLSPFPQVVYSCPPVMRTLF